MRFHRAFFQHIYLISTVLYTFSALFVDNMQYFFYLSGVFEGTPAFLGYFFEVPATFSIAIKDLFASPNANFITSFTLPPSKNTDDFASCTSSSHSPDF